MRNPTRTLRWLLPAALLLAVSSASALDRGPHSRDRDERRGGDAHHARDQRRGGDAHHARDQRRGGDAHHARDQRRHDAHDGRSDRHDDRHGPHHALRRHGHERRQAWNGWGHGRRQDPRVFIGRDGYGHVDMGGGCKVWFDARGDRTANTRHCSDHQFRRAHQVRTSYRPERRW